MEITKRIFDEQPMLGEIDTEILRTKPVKEGVLVCLSQTIFFPRGGGQPCEAGTLGEEAVLDVFEEEGTIWHLVKKLPCETPLKCRISLEQRHDHMQQHSAQHLLSAVIDQLCGVPTVIARIEKESSHIELAAPLTEEQLMAVMKKAREITRAALPFCCTYHTPEEAAKRTVRGKITPHERIRLVEIEGFDCNACGGTHCADTADTAPIRLIGSKMVRGGYRLYFVAGARAEEYEAMADLRVLRLGTLAGTETPAETEEKICRAFRRAEELEEECRILKEKALAAEGQLLWAEARPAAHGRFIFAACEERETKELKALCDRLTAEEAVFAALTCRQGDQLTLLMAQQKNLTAADLGRRMKDFLAKHNGKGGGSKIAAQGMIPYTAEAAEDFRALAEQIAAGE